MNFNRWIDNNLHDLSNKTFVIVGGTGSIGAFIVEAIARKNGNIILPVRNLTKGEALKTNILKLYPKMKIDIIDLDIADEKSIIGFSHYLHNIFFNYLIINVGIYHQPSSFTSTGKEKHYMTNFYGPKMLMELLKDKIIENETKIIIQSSISYHFYRLDFKDIYSTSVKNKTKIYGRSKLFLTLYALYEKRILSDSNIQINIVHPGVSATNFFNSKNKNFIKPFYFFIVPLMKIIFHSPKKASLSAIKAIDLSTNYGYWIGPKGPFGVWGYPSIKKLKPFVLSEELQNTVKNL